MDDLSIYRPSNLLYTQEKISRYQPGGYHPVRLGDNFKDDRYKVHHKLGWGGFSTVWLAKDKIRKQWVSIKILTADSSKDSAELRHLQSLADYSHGNLGSKYIVQLHDNFLHQGPNGRHQCLVFELLGPSVDAVLREYCREKEPVEPETVLKMSKQLLQAVSFIHEAGYAHGDLSGGNVSFTSKRLSKSAEKDLFEVIGVPQTEPLARQDGKPLAKGLPNQLVQAASWLNWDDEDDEDLRIIDLGEAFRKGAEPRELAQPGSLRAPETIFTNRFDYRVDLWRAGIMINSLIFQAIPFQFLGDIEVLVAEMIEYLGPLPPAWRPQYDNMRRNSKYGAQLPPGNRQSSRSKVEEMFDRCVGNEDKDDLKPLIPVIQGLMRFMPSDRISASQALQLLQGKKGRTPSPEKGGRTPSPGKGGRTASPEKSRQTASPGKSHQTPSSTGLSRR